eukprot:5788477-Amphidinium_carterae.1
MKQKREQANEGMSASMLEELMTGPTSSHEELAQAEIRATRKYEDIDGMLLLLLLTDDILCAGTDRHQKALDVEISHGSML